MLDPKLHEPPTTGELAEASLEAAGKGTKAGVEAIEKIVKFIVVAVIFLAALHVIGLW